MERKIGKYKVSVYGSYQDWSWHLLPSIEVAWDESGVFINLAFLCFGAYLNIEDEIKEQEWNDRIASRISSLTDTEEDEAEEED